MLSPTSTLQNAACRGLSEKEADKIFFPREGASTKRAEALCGSCLDKDDCLAAALSFEVPGEKRYGIWGGLTRTEREQMVGG